MLRHILRKVREAKLVYKLVVVNVALVLLPVLLVGTMSNERLERQLRQQFAGETQAILQQRIDDISEKTAGIESFTSNINYGPYLSSFLTSTFHNTPEEVENYRVIVDYLESLVGSNRLISSCSIFYLNTTVSEHWPLFYRADRLDSAYLTQNGLDDASAKWFTGGNVQLKDIRFNKVYFYGSDEMVFIQPLYSKVSSTLLGFMKVGISTGKLLSSLESPDVKEMNCVAIGPSGQVLYDPDNAWGSIQQSVLAMQADSQIAGETILARRQIPQVGVTVYMARSLAVIAKDIAAAKRTLWLVIALCAVAASTALWAIVSLLTKRIDHVVGSMRSVSSGDFSHRANVDFMDEAGVVASSLNYMLDNIVQLQQTLLHREASLKKAEINALQSQINPHFIYNTLEVFKIKLEERDEPVLAGALLSLSRMLRYSTKWSQLSTLRDEMEHLEHYVRLQKILLRGRVNLFVQCERELLACQTPKMILQPLVENSIVHGLKGRPGVNITVAAARRENDLFIEVFDDGEGIDPMRRDAVTQELLSGAAPESESPNVRLSGIGIGNINDRLRLMHGDAYGVTLDSESGLYTKVTLRLPFTV